MTCTPYGILTLSVLYDVQESTMRSIPSFEANPKGYADLYQTVLIDTPVGKPHLDIKTKLEDGANQTPHQFLTWL